MGEEPGEASITEAGDGAAWGQLCSLHGAGEVQEDETQNSLATERS